MEPEDLLPVVVAGLFVTLLAVVLLGYAFSVPYGIIDWLTQTILGIGVSIIIAAAFVAVGWKFVQNAI